MLMLLRLFTTILILLSGTTFAGEANVLKVDIRPLGDNRYSIDTTVYHADTGWEHYANSWEVLDLDGKPLGKRTLLHPHVNEQPFTRNAVLNIPVTIKRIMIRANDLVHGIGGKTVIATVPK
ncbi:MAG: hypothetical protein KZQ90_06685 [Candidatus Thiodiazotropha sp. (ex Codakia rugifera)]|nr:hypothetical protein [Candidatus Thiodiazotropha sp. (ex Codakia rugifera)]